MRVSEGAARTRESSGPRGARRFGEALRKAVRAGTPRAATPAAEPLAARAPALRRAASDRSEGALRGRREGFREEALAAEARADRPELRPAEAISSPELRAVVRTLPLAIQTFGVREGAPLALSFGRSLDVELRPVPGGIELVLRPEPRLARSAASELPSVVAALAAKGIAVARAEVRTRGGGTAAPRVDLPAVVR